MRSRSSPLLLPTLGLLLANPAWAAPTSQYTDLTNCPRDTSMDADAEEHGADAPNICPGPGGQYDINEYFSAYDVHRRVSLIAKPESFSVVLRPSHEECPVARFGKMLEWRMSEGKPFAVIQRVTCYALTETGSGPGKRLAEYLVVKGLQGFESIDGAVNTRTKKANEKARALADAGLQGR